MGPDALAEVEKAAAQARRQTVARNRWIRTARAEGHSLRVIAERARLSHTAIKNITASG